MKNQSIIDIFKVIFMKKHLFGEMSSIIDDWISHDLSDTMLLFEK